MINASEEADRRDRRSAVRGRLLSVTGLALCVGSFVVLITTSTSQSLITECIKLLTGLALLPTGFALYRLGVKNIRNLRVATAPTAQEELARDPRLPVLYLRSFKHDAIAGRVEYLDTGSDEEQLTAVLRRIGPVVAVGNPSERQVTLGASRIYLSDDEWQDWVKSQMLAAAVVIFRASDTDAFWWEVATAAIHLPAAKTAFLLPRDPLVYQRFRRQFTERFGQPLPNSLPAIKRSKVLEAPIPPNIWGLMYFNSAGQPVFRSWLSAEKLYTLSGIIGWFGVTFGRHAARTKQSGYVYLLRPVLRRTGASTYYVPTPSGVYLLVVGLFVIVPYLLARTTIRGVTGSTARLLPGWHEDDTHVFRLVPTNHDSLADGDCEAPHGRPPFPGKPLSRKKAVIAGTLQLFLGAFGAGRFYIGSKAVGGCQLGLTALGLVLALSSNQAFSTAALFPMFGVIAWAFIDAIRLYVGSISDSHRRELI
jgi:TM2 domain-containing membrane protein YozV